MPIDLVSPVTVQPAVQADRQLVAGFQVRESDPNTGIALANPTVTIYWLKLDKVTGAVRGRGAHTFAPAAFAIEKPDGAQTYRANIKARMYQELVTAGVFVAGTVT